MLVSVVMGVHTHYKEGACTDNTTRAHSFRRKISVVHDIKSRINCTRSRDPKVLVASKRGRHKAAATAARRQRQSQK